MLYLDSSNDYVLPFRWLGYRIEPTFSYRINGIENIESVREKYGKTVIKNIKAAKRRIVIDEDSKEYESLVELQDMTYKRQGRSNPIRGDFSIEVMKKASENGNGKLLIARDEEGIPHSAGFFLFDDRTCYYLLGGQNPEFKSDGSQNLLLDAAISFAGTVSQNFDFEGSMVEGIENFFRQFGGNQIVNYHVSKQRIIPDLYEVLKPRIKRIIGFKI